MKNILKKSVTWLMILLLSVGTMGTFLPGASAEAEAAETETPKYMAKIVPCTDDSKDRLGQYVQVKAGKTYTLSFKLYVIEKGVLLGFNGEVSEYYPGGGTKFVQEASSEPGTVTTVGYVDSYTPASDETIYVNIQCNSGAFYIWDVKFTANNSEENLFKNADFAEGNGSFINWYYSGWGGSGEQEMKTVAESDAFEQTTGRTVISYNTALFSKAITGSQREELELTGEPAYMAKLAYKSDDDNHNAIWHDIPSADFEVGAEYTFQCNYYVEPKESVQYRIAAVAFSSDREWSCTANNTGDSNVNKVGTFSLSYTTQSGDTGLKIRIENMSGGTVYLWNIKMYKGNEELTSFRNADFTEGVTGSDGNLQPGTWCGWYMTNYNYVTINSKKQNDASIAATGHEIVPYVAVWSAQATLEESIDFTYKTKLEVPIYNNQVPLMKFEMSDGNKTIKTKEITGVANADGTYSFTYDDMLPQQMAYDIIATLTVPAKDGTVWTQKKIFSMKQYCKILLEDNTSASQLKNLIADLLRYGAEVQKYANLEDTITTGLELTGLGTGNGDLSTISNVVTDRFTGIQSSDCVWKSVSLVLDGKVTLRFKFTSNDISKLVVKVNGEAYSNFKYSQESACYYVDVPMSALEFDKKLEVDFYVNGNQTGATLNYSVNTYLYNKRTAETEVNLLKALYAYGLSAESYHSYMNPETIGLDNEYEDNWAL